MHNTFLKTAALTVAATATAATFASTASAQVVMTLRNTIDVSSTASSANNEFIGSNPSALGYDGTSLYIAGFNASGGTADTAIVSILDPTVNGAASYGPAFGIQSTNNLRGYSGLAVGGNGDVAAAWDNGGAAATGLVEYTSAGAANWSVNLRGGSGVDYDPGFGAVDNGVATGGFGSGRRWLYNEDTGATIYNSSQGFIFNNGFVGTFTRDMAFDPDTGDLYARSNNAILKAERTGGNSASASLLVGPATAGNTNADAPFVSGQNIEYVNLGDGFDFLVANDRSTSIANQQFGDVVEFLDPTTGDAIDLSVIGYDTTTTGVGYYDFQYDAGTSTLAVLDFASREVLIFDVAVPEPASLGLLSLGGLALLRRRK